MSLSSILGGFETHQKQFFDILESGKNRFFQRKIGDFFADFFFLRFYFVKIVSMPPENRFFADKSVEKSDFLFPGKENSPQPHLVPNSTQNMS